MNKLLAASLFFSVLLNITPVVGAEQFYVVCVPVTIDRQYGHELRTAYSTRTFSIFSDKSSQVAVEIKSVNGLANFREWVIFQFADQFFILADKKENPDATIIFNRLSGYARIFRRPPPSKTQPLPKGLHHERTVKNIMKCERAKGKF